MIGLDVGECGVRAAQLVRLGDSYRLCHVATAGIATYESESNSGPGREQSIRQAIKSCLCQAAFQGRSVRTALSPPDIEFHSLELPNTVSEDLDQIVCMEVKRLRGQRQERIETRHWVLPNTQVPAPTAIAVTAPFEDVVQTVAVCGESGANCADVDTASTALARFGCLLGAWRFEQVWGLLDLGFRQARLTLCVEDVPVLVRTVGPGGAELTKRIAGGLGTSVKTAETHKREHGIALTARGVRQDERRPPPSELAPILLGILRSDLNDLASEIKRSYEYVLGCYPAKRAADLILVGGGAAMGNLPEYLADSLGITVRRASDFLGGGSCTLSVPGGQEGFLDRASLAVGLALED